MLMDERGGAGLEVHAWSCSSRTPARNGRSSIDGSQPLMLSSFCWAKENEEASRLTTIPGLRPDYRIGARCRCRGRAEEFRPRSRSRRMAWLGSEAVHHRRQAEAARNQQARQQVSAQTIDSRGARRALPISPSADTPLGRWAKELMRRTHRNVAALSLWPTSWRGSPGRCCSAGNRLTPKGYPWPRRGSLGRSESAGRANGVCEEGDDEMA